MSEKSKRILLVDDNAAIHEDFKQILKTENVQKDAEQIVLERELFDDADSKDEEACRVSALQYKIDDAYQGEEAMKMVDRASADGEPYALVFMDVRMPPGIDGIETIQRIWEKHPDIEMIICTAHSDYSWEEIVKVFGPTDHLLFIQKPFNSVSIKQIALTMTRKWELDRQNREHIRTLESRIAERTADLEKLVAEKENFIEKINEEMMLAEIVQKHLLPGKLPQNDSIRIAASYVPSISIGGDFYDVIPIDENTNAFLIFDVSGHGIAAALITAIGKFSFRQHLLETSSPEVVMELVNRDIFTSTPQQMYLTAFLIVYNVETGNAVYSSAGHTAQLYFQKEENKVLELKSKGFFLGINECSSYEKACLKIKAGDKLILYTDGLTETLNSDDMLFGRKNVIKAVQEKPQLNCNELLQHILKRNEEFKAGEPRLDDLCLLTIDIKKV